MHCWFNDASTCRDLELKPASHTRAFSGQPEDVSKPQRYEYCRQLLERELTSRTEAVAVYAYGIETRLRYLQCRCQFLEASVSSRSRLRHRKHANSHWAVAKSMQSRVAGFRCACNCVCSDDSSIRSNSFSWQMYVNHEKCVIHVTHITLENASPRNCSCSFPQPDRHIQFLSVLILNTDKTSAQVHHSSYDVIKGSSRKRSRDTDRGRASIGELSNR